ncbi:MAG: cupin domain-containing protein [Chitinophagaceae bacterium]|nr:MAG: cupin domain-containing protein [Chitinophagaceae bacterium]
MIDIINFGELAAGYQTQNHNTGINIVNDHIVRLAIMTTPYAWHYHPNSDETFIGVEDILIVETEEKIYELGPGMSLTIPKNVMHATRPGSGRSVNLTVERTDAETVFRD